MRYPSWLKKHHKICALINQLQLDDAAMRETMMSSTGKASRKDLTEPEQIRFINVLERMLPHDKGKPRGPRANGNQIVMATADQKTLIQHIFFDNLGWDVARLNGFIFKMSKGKAASLGTLAKWNAATVIEAGKNMHQRELAKGIDGQSGGDRQARAGR